MRWLPIFSFLTCLRRGVQADAATCTAVGNTSYDYIIVGSGPAGLVLADRLSAANASVLLLERGPPSFGRWMPETAQLSSEPDSIPEPNWRPGWLNGTNLTRFDVPGLAQRIYSDGTNVNCTDVDGPLIAGCLLGGGMTINAALWWRPPAVEWDENYSGVPGWSSADMADPVERVFSRIPGTDRPSTDGAFAPGYDGGWAVVADALRASNWSGVRANTEPDQKNRTFSYPNFFIKNGLRDGPHATYLVSASERPNFKMVMNTMVRRVVRNGAHITGVEAEPSGTGALDVSNPGLCAGMIPVTEQGGRVILSGGHFGTAKMLLRSGIGPEDQLRVVQAAEDIVSEADWLRLPVGQGLRDHTVTSLEIQNPAIPRYDYSSDAAYYSPPDAQREAYMTNRTGMLTVTGNYQAPISWMLVTGSDGLQRQLQTTCRVYGSTNNSMTCSVFLTRGATSFGALSITPDLKMNISVSPYAVTAEDRSAIVQGIKIFTQALQSNPEIVITQPPANVTIEDFVENYPDSITSRRGIHYMGTAKMGTDSGLTGGTSVVDADTRVYGTDNLFVVDASILRGLTTSNPSGAIMAVAERASERILALDTRKVLK
ncbi:hypothetical protein N0V82_007561 [Gnomoniopsis sp. IMI 355080]|nr:hypothetical protein N0V82_007561 [Gnomoniopsis sp. IMI 355080]